MHQGLTSLRSYEVFKVVDGIGTRLETLSKYSYGDVALDLANGEARIFTSKHGFDTVVKNDKGKIVAVYARIDGKTVKVYSRKGN